MAAGGKKSLGVLLYLLAGLCVWGLYVLCLILVSKDILHEYSTDEIHRSTLMKEVVTFLLVPQVVTVVLFILIISAFLIDILTKDNKRIHFLTTSYINAISILFLVVAGFSMFLNAALILYLRVAHHGDHIDDDQNMAGSGGYNDDNDDGIPTLHDHVMAGVQSQLMIIGGWAKTFFICIVLMLGIYSVYFCYWPHSLRYRRRVDKRLLSNIADVDDPDDDDL